MPAYTEPSDRNVAEATTSMRESARDTTRDLSLQDLEAVNSIPPKEEETSAAVHADASDGETLDGEEDEAPVATGTTTEGEGTRGPQLVLPKLAFERLVQEIALDQGADLQLDEAALNALQEASEALLVQHFVLTRGCASHADRDTISVKDMRLANWMRRQYTGMVLGPCE
ncbi:hypothetical protein B0A48_13394 [Cryoendolithus antarcticus]|uniref:Core Histone H2A/H2B/H3 domain-containing protein n=1 Tax=Cryoendolithus antarcticus TaxID=1507870 RepID=A0A1V8SQ88_9PEZI|nr:hypothetical protein B0A48_13394 [Cryoendolithus antarcticus]